MEVYSLSSNTYAKTNVLEDTKSTIWTERYSAFGDCTILAKPTAKNRSLLTEGAFLGLMDSDTIMQLTSVETTKKQGETLITAKGVSLESILRTRQFDPKSYGRDYQDTEIGYLIRSFVSDSMVDGYYSSLDVWPGFSVAAAYPTGDKTDYSTKQGSLYDIVKELADTAGYGFRVFASNSNLRFEVYKGQSRSGTVFSVLTDSLANTSKLRSNENYLNALFIKYKFSDGSVDYFGYGSASATGFDRRVGYLDATDIDPKNRTIDWMQSIMRGRGRTELRKHRLTRVFDGEITAENPYEYGRGKDYYLGDTVYLQDEDGNKFATTVIEYIRSSDSSGETAYPSFEAS